MEVTERPTPTENMDQSDVVKMTAYRNIMEELDESVNELSNAVLVAKHESVKDYIHPAVRAKLKAAVDNAREARKMISRLLAEIEQDQG